VGLGFRALDSAH